MEAQHDEIIRLQEQVKRLVSDAESEKRTRADANREINIKYGGLEERMRQNELSQSGQKVSLGTLERVFWIVVAAVVGFFSRSHN